MSSFFDGHIASIKAEIVEDIVTLLDYVERWNKNDKDIEAANAAQRVETYLEAYKANEEKNV